MAIIGQLPPLDRSDLQAHLHQSSGEVEPVTSAKLETSEQDLLQATYMSPVYRVDVEATAVVLEFRDKGTGEVTRQYPTEKEMEAYRAANTQEFGITEPSPAEAAAVRREESSEIKEVEEVRLDQAAPKTARSSEQERSGISIDV